MPDHDARAIANEFIKRYDRGISPNQMKIQKLVYIAHGWNLAINHEPLVSDAFEAWDNGPVVRKIWNHIRDFGRNARGGLLGHPHTREPFLADLSEEEEAIIQRVWNRYSKYSVNELSEKTHEPGTPWSNAYFGRGRNSLLDDPDIEQHFTELAIAGRTR